MDNDVVDYEIAFDDRAGVLETQDEGEALHHAIFAALEGRGSTVLDPVGERWKIEVDTKADDFDRYHPVIVHFIGLHSAECSDAGELGRTGDLTNPDKTRARNASEPSLSKQDRLG